MNNNKEAGLMKKTKAQLVEIILRKDDEEARLRKSLESANKDIEGSSNRIKLLTMDLNKANANVQQHQAGMDELTSQKVAAEEVAEKFRKERNAARGWNWVLAIAVITVSLLWILL